MSWPNLVQLPWRTSNSAKVGFDFATEVDPLTSAALSSRV